ncbi:NEDD8-specific protease 2 [Smittium culicis]|uniref:NEDD8-specific protease 2 n=1 Tax=Smittium culicis TaxID=133412 RepID=A0A1R1YC57_9FUNG|nr:NEDD8-specific protease 2 [Smittium culicis]
MYSSAAKTVKDGEWLLDSIIGFYFEYLSQTLNLEARKILLFQPSIAHLIAQASEIEYAKEALPPEVNDMDYLFLPTNNGDSENVNGSHWSLLVYEKSNNIFRYYDSLKKANLEPTRILVERLCILFDCEKTNLIIEKSEQQYNDSDCGVYLLLFAETLIKKLLESLEKSKKLIKINGLYDSHGSRSTKDALFSIEKFNNSENSPCSNFDKDLPDYSNNNAFDPSNENFWDLEELSYPPHLKRKEISLLIHQFSK